MNLIKFLKCIFYHKERLYTGNTIDQQYCLECGMFHNFFIKKL